MLKADVQHPFLELVQFFRSALPLPTLLLGLLSTSSAIADEPNPVAHWQDDSVRLEVDLSVEGACPDAYEAVIAAVSAWQLSARGLPTLVVTTTDNGDVGYVRNGQNANVLRFAEGGSRLAGKALAVTIVTSDARTGRIVDADILINGRYRFELVDDEGDDLPAQRDGSRPAPDYDFQNVLTHEIGHFLGLPEERVDEEATMFATSRPGETLKRDLNATDEYAISHLYSLRPEQELDEAPPVGCGGASIAGRAPRQLWAMSALLAGLLVIARRRLTSTPAANAGWLLAVLLGCVPGAEPVPETDAESATVVAVTSAWEDGVIWSDVSLRPNGCPRCAPSVLRVPGGQLDGLRQQIGLLRPVEVGDQVGVEWLEPEHFEL